MNYSFHINVDQYDTNIFCDKIYDSDRSEFISEDYLKINYFDEDDDDEDEGEIYDINKCFHSYLYDQIFELLDIELFFDDNIIINGEQLSS